MFILCGIVFHRYNRIFHWEVDVLTLNYFPWCSDTSSGFIHWLWPQTPPRSLHVEPRTEGGLSFIHWQHQDLLNSFCSLFSVRKYPQKNFPPLVGFCRSSWCWRGSFMACGEGPTELSGEAMTWSSTLNLCWR